MPTEEQGCCFDDCFALTGAKLIQSCSRMCSESCLGPLAGRKTVYKRFCPVTQTHSLVWPHELACSRSVPERLRPPRWKGYYLVVELFRALWWISVDEEVARSDSLINNDHGPLLYGLGPASNSSFNGIGLELLAYMDVWDDWIKWNLCLDLHSELSSLMCHRWKKKKRKKCWVFFPGRSRGPVERWHLWSRTDSSAHRTRLCSVQQPAAMQRPVLSMVLKLILLLYSESKITPQPHPSEM